MKKIFYLLTLASFVSCSENKSDSNTKIESDTKETPQLITKSEQTLSSDIMTPEVLWSFGRLGDVQVSPDGSQLLYGVSYFSIEQDKSNRELFVMNTDGSNKKQLTHTSFGEYNAVWHPNGKDIVYLSSESGSMQAWSLNIKTGKKTQISNTENNITNLMFSPNGKKVMLTMNVKVDDLTKDVYTDLPKADGKIITDLMYRHWDSWEDGNYSHIFIADFNNGEINNEADIMPNEAYDSPLQPFGGIDEINWNAEGSKLAYTCKKLKGKAYTLSTNSDIYIYNLKSKETTNITEGMMGYDRSPFFSPDGSKLYWLSMERAGFEADKNRLFEINLETKEKKYLTENFDYSPSCLVWDKDGTNLFFVAGVMATFQIYNLNLSTLDITAITKGDYDYHSVALANDKLIATRVDMTKPQEIYSIDNKTGDVAELSFENKHLLSQLKMPTVEKRWIETTDNKKMLTWIIYPPNFDKSKKYPTILYCEGGPQSPLSQFWSYRWNFSMMASNGYIVVAPNRRGTLTMGQQWTDEISKDNSGQAMKDLLQAIDVMKEEPFVDEDKLSAIGASFGAFSVNWLAGNHNGRFKAFISHCGVFNSEMEYMTTDEMFFDNWEKGGAPWEKDNEVAKKSYAGSPHNFVQNWDTPILIIHGGHDFRIPYTQGMAAFNSAQLRGIPSKFLFFPSESHWVLKPQNGILWQREFKKWLDTYSK